MRLLGACMLCAVTQASGVLSRMFGRVCPCAGSQMMRSLTVQACRAQMQHCVHLGLCRARCTMTGHQAGWPACTCRVCARLGGLQCEALAQPGTLKYERAGLWEFPSLAAGAGAGAAERAAALDAYLARLVGCWGLLNLSPASNPSPNRDAQHPTGLPSTCVLEDGHAGELVHVFSHIRMTIRVRRLVVAAPVRSPRACRPLRQHDPECLWQAWPSTQVGYNVVTVAALHLHAMPHFDASLAMLHLMLGGAEYYVFLACTWNVALTLWHFITPCCSGCKGAHDILSAGNTLGLVYGTWCAARRQKPAASTGC